MIDTIKREPISIGSFFVQSKYEVIKMSKKTFTAEEVELLSKNKYVQNASKKSITYSNEFKIHFIAESKKGKTSRLIF